MKHRFYILHRGANVEQAGQACALARGGCYRIIVGSEAEPGTGTYRCWIEP